MHAVGHDVVGVDVDPVLVQAAEADYPGPRWVVADLADLDLAAHGIPQRFAAIVCAGNVLTFSAPSTRRDVHDRFAAHLASDGRIVVDAAMEELLAEGTDLETLFLTSTMSTSREGIAA